MVEEAVVKMVDIAGNRVAVPHWANWVAQDESGKWYCFQSKPSARVTCWLQPKNQRGPRKVWPIDDRETAHAPDWRETMMPV